MGERAILFYLSFDLRGTLRSKKEPASPMHVADCGEVASILLNAGSHIRKVAMHDNYLNVNWVRIDIDSCDNCFLKKKVIP